MTQAAVEHFQSEYQQVNDDSDHYLKTQRERGIGELARIGFPTTRNENWKYTDVKNLLRQNFQRADSAAKEINSDLYESARFPELNAIELVFVNGAFNEALSSKEESVQNALITALSVNDEAKNKLISDHVARYAKTDKHGFAALNTAFVKDGAFINIPDNAEIERAIHLIFISNQTDGLAITHPRNLIVLGSNSKATVIESYVGTDDQYCTNTVTEISAGSCSKLEHYKLQQEGSKSFHIGYTSAQLEKDSTVQSHSISLGGSLVRNDIDAVLADRGAHIGLNGLYMTKNEQHVDNHTRVEHQSPYTTSDEIYRGVLDGKSRAVFNGKVVVHKDAQKTDAQQANANLLMSDDAEIDTKPELEIYADDVKCSHGATVGQLDENMLFYLRTRAIDEATARSLLTFAFADEVVAKMDCEAVRKRIETQVVGLLPDASLIREFV